jgi:O-antigen ligase
LFFVWAVISAGFICFVIAFWHSINLKDGHLVFNATVPGQYTDTNVAPPSYFFYQDFSFFVHPTYFSMYITFAITILLHFRKSGYAKKTSVPALIFLFILTFFVNSKAGIVLCLIIVFFNTALYVRNKLIPLLITVCAIVSIFAVIHTNSRFYYIKNLYMNPKYFLTQIEQKDYRGMVDRYGIERIPIWFVSSEIISENVLFGVGTGDVKTELIKKYDLYKLTEASAQQLNAHNQYLETFIATGIIGFVLLLSIFIVPLVRSIRNRDLLLFLFLVIVLYNFMFESMMNQVSGIIFIVFFYCFLIFIRKDSHSMPVTV